MNFDFSADHLQIQSQAKAFAEKEITPNLDLLENNLKDRLALFQKMAKAGLFSLALKNDTIAFVLALLEIAKADAGLAVSLGVTNMVAEAIYRFGTEEHKKKILTHIDDGQLVPFSFALTEKHAGSDAKELSTTATLNKGLYILQGEKQFITNADLSGIILVFAKINSAENSKGITAFIVERGIAGFSVTKHERKIGLLTANLVDLKFEDCKIPSSQLLGKVGEGFNIALKCLDAGRIGIAAQSIGIAEAALEAAQNYAKNRIQFGKPLKDNQTIAFKLADMKVKIEAGKGLMLKAAWLKSQGRPYTLEASMAKLFCSETCNQVADEALQIHGGYGYVKGLPPEKLFRDARATTIYEGTSEIQRIIISRQL